MKYNTEIHNRRSLRLPGYDYTQDGLYFITICVQNRECLLGRIENNEIILSTIGEIANQYWSDISIHFKHVVMHEHIIMPNHVPGIIELSHSNITVYPLETHHVGTRHGVSLREDTTESVGTSHGMSLHGVSVIKTTLNNNISQKPSIDRKFGKPIPGSISVIINQYKSSVKRWYNKNEFRSFQWQSRFFDHIIHSEDDFMRIADYIIDNPAKWREDKFYQQ